MNLRFPEKCIKEIAERYEYQDDAQVISLSQQVQANHCLNKKQLKCVAQWKSPRSSKHVENNADEYVKEVTGFAFSTNNERARIESLLILDGVSWPTASVLLHLFHKQPYPILDFRALWSINANMPSQYKFVFWERYVAFCRNIATNNQVSMRTLDRALWQYSKENQKV